MITVKTKFGFLGKAFYFAICLLRPKKDTMKHFKDKLSYILELPLDLNCAAINQYFWNIFFCE